MGKSEPIRNYKDIERMKQYLLAQGRWRDHALITMGLNTALRISDLLKLRWGNVYNFKTSTFYLHIYIQEQKTKKQNIVSINPCICDSLNLLKSHLPTVSEEDFLFQSRVNQPRPIHRSRAYAIIREMAEVLDMEGVISCHSLRKSFGYHAWKRGYSPAVIMEIYNHSSLQVTRRYLSINQDDKDQIYMDMSL